ncbi:unnamed protein product [Ilex paraguariensis]|uniref:BZIP domain-containing protein n=1 Tax=Ilex paraguariensis TaxID=185542 RepID=A0ABC8RGC6_9AQUA
MPQLQFYTQNTPGGPPQTQFYIQNVPEWTTTSASQLSFKYRHPTTPFFPFLLQPFSLSISGFPVMLSTVPTTLSSDGLFTIPFPDFQGGFTPWDCQEPYFDFQNQDGEYFFCLNQTQKPVLSNSGSENSIPISLSPNSGSDNSNLMPLSPNSGPYEQNPISLNPNSGSDNSTPTSLSPNSGSDEPNRKKNKSRSGSEESNQMASVIDERKQRRMISNRESARRSRMRKQKNLENIRNQVTRLKIGNRELANQLRVATHHCQLLGNDNHRLRSEAVMLRQRLWDIRQVLLVHQLQQQLSETPTTFNHVLRALCWISSSKLNKAYSVDSTQYAISITSALPKRSSIHPLVISCKRAVSRYVLADIYY